MPLCFKGLTVQDYHNVNDTLAGLPAGLLNRLQSILNASTQHVAVLHPYAHITHTLACFH